MLWIACEQSTSHFKTTAQLQNFQHSVKARSHRARIRKAERRIRKADADYPQKRKIRGRFSGSRPHRFCPRGKLLLDTIKQHPVLYDKTNPRYKEAEYKKEIWKKIAQDLGVTEAMCQNKFKNLKDNFTKIKTKLKDKSRSGAGAKDVPTVKWKHFEAMIPIMEKVHEEPVSEMSAEGLSDDAQLEPPATDHIEEWSELDSGTSSSTTTSVHPAASSDASET
ncbi:hypothetical protein HPB50_013935 [Hyalomma asiaticum]|uniref:Uncharacterized protein n=1 Tax=Hyalomma asiaticum TaxID=266040 RepID=A0ACB7SGV8_HYAAI|nr:hypothetical protein HPB50_013935 [Hyalomma asiaticum]